MLPLHQTDADFAGFIIDEVNARLFKGPLYLEGGRKVSFHDSFVLLDPLQRRDSDPCGPSQFNLAPAQERARSPYLRRVPHQFGVFPI
jgi:hypothetical protein